MICGALGVVISPHSIVDASIGEVEGTDQGQGDVQEHGPGAKKTLGVPEESSSSSWSGNRWVAEWLRCGSGVGITIGSMPGPWATRVVTNKGGLLGGVGVKHIEWRALASRQH